MESVCRLSTSVIRLSKSISKHSLRSFLHCAECVFLAPSGSAKFIAFWCKKNRRATTGEQKIDVTAFEQFQGSYEMRGYTFRKEQFVCSFDADGHFLHLSMR